MARPVHSIWSSWVRAAAPRRATRCGRRPAPGSSSVQIDLVEAIAARPRGPGCRRRRWHGGARSRRACPEACARLRSGADRRQEFLDALPSPSSRAWRGGRGASAWSTPDRRVARASRWTARGLRRCPRRRAGPAGPIIETAAAATAEAAGGAARRTGRRLGCAVHRLWPRGSRLRPYAAGGPPPRLR